MTAAQPRLVTASWCPSTRELPVYPWAKIAYHENPWFSILGLGHPVSNNYAVKFGA